MDHKKTVSARLAQTLRGRTLLTMIFTILLDLLILVGRIAEELLWLLGAAVICLYNRLSSCVVSGMLIREEIKYLLKDGGS